MSNNYQHEQPDELEQQQQQQQQPTLPLLYLPVELAEEVSLYFQGWSAANLLRVSRSFHNLFLPRVWVVLDTFSVIEDEQARQRMLEKYGHCVRIINHVMYVKQWLNFDWLPFVKRAVHIKTRLYRGFTVEDADMLTKLIKQSNELQKLDLLFDGYDIPVKFDELTAAINGLKYLERIKCQFGNGYVTWDVGSEWKRTAGIVALFHHPSKSKLRLKMEFNTGFNEADVQELAPYVLKLEAYYGHICTADLADALFGIKDEDGQPLVFPQLKELRMKSCCLKNEYYGLKSITASRFPQLQCLYTSDNPCNNENIGIQNWNEHETYNWKPEYSGYPHVIVPYQRWECLTELETGIISSSILMDIIGLNPLLQKLTVGSKHSRGPKVNDPSKHNHDQFHIDTILNHLPHLLELEIGRLNSRIIVDSAAIPMKRRHEMLIEIGCQMSITPVAVAYILQIPQLYSLTLSECVFVDVDQTIQLLQSSTATYGVWWFNLSPLEWNHDLALAITDKMPILETFTSNTCPREDLAIFTAKCRPRDRTPFE
ncbi:hypothetical protein GQ42DRAFT_170011 [Ramicandelaber brevisporus]|nr:hypothetical protein GQ42DRAFT_170011 [Ramicandelaber brevisporus]